MTHESSDQNIPLAPWDAFVVQLTSSDQDATGASLLSGSTSVAEQLNEADSQADNTRNSLTDQGRASNDSDEIKQEAATEEDCILSPQW